jgi:hypothetical protein
MSLPVTQIKIHHEGAGAPTDNVDRFAKGGYTVGVGQTLYRLFRSPDQDYSTLNLNYVVAGICFSGQRQDNVPDSPAYNVTDQEITLVKLACQEMRALGWILPGIIQVTPHDNLDGSATSCPGTRVYDRWDEIVAACEASVPPDPTPTPSEVLLTTVAQPGRTKNGRQGTARPCPPFGCVLLENGASLHGDQSSPPGRVWVSNNSTVIATGHKLVDITPMLDSNGVPSGQGLVVLYDLGNGDIGTYNIGWS